MTDIDKVVNELFDYATTTRGMIINQTIMLERAIDEYLCLHFCKTQEQRTELMDLVFGTERMTFDLKKQIFKIISSRYHPNFSKENPIIHSDIKIIVETRNIFAHYLLDTTENGIKEFDQQDKIIGFIKFKNERVLIKYNIHGIVKHLDTIDKSIEKIMALNHSVRKAENQMQ